MSFFRPFEKFELWSFEEIRSVSFEEILSVSYNNLSKVDLANFEHTWQIELQWNVKKDKEKDEIDEKLPAILKHLFEIRGWACQELTLPRQLSTFLLEEKADTVD